MEIHKEIHFHESGRLIDDYKANCVSLQLIIKKKTLYNLLIYMLLYAILLLTNRIICFQHQRRSYIEWIAHKT